MTIFKKSLKIKTSDKVKKIRLITKDNNIGTKRRDLPTRICFCLVSRGIITAAYHHELKKKRKENTEKKKRKKRE